MALMIAVANHGEGARLKSIYHSLAFERLTISERFKPNCRCGRKTRRLAAAIAKMLDDPTLACKFGVQAAGDCRDWFGARKMFEWTLSFYSKAVKSHGVH